MCSKEGNGAPTDAAELVSRLAWGTSPELYLSYGVVSKKGGVPAATRAAAAAAAPSFTALSPPLGLDYFGVFDGGAAIAEYLKVRMESAVAEQIEHELRARTPPIHESCGGGGGGGGGVTAWWKTVVREAFRTVDVEVVGGGAAGEAAQLVGATALVALVLEKYIVLSNCGGSRAVISRGGEAKQLTNDKDRPNRQKQRVENVRGRVVESTNTIYDVLLPTSRAFGCSPYKPYVSMEPEVALIEREAEDEFLILATAALWDAVTPAAACSFVRQRLSTARITMPWQKRLDMSRGSPTILASELADHAVRAGGHGDVAVAVVLFRKFWDDPTSPPAASSSQHIAN